MTIWAEVYKKSRLPHLVSEFMSLRVFGLIGPAVHSGFGDTNSCLQKEAKLLRWDCEANSLKSEAGSHKQDGFLRLHLHQISVCLWFPSAMQLPDEMWWEAGDRSLSHSGLRMTSASLFSLGPSRSSSPWPPLSTEGCAANWGGG